MKTRLKHLSKSMVSIVLSLIMVVSMVTVGVISAFADMTVTIYFSPKDEWVSNNYTVKVHAQREKSNESSYGDFTASDTGQTINGNPVYQASVTTWSGNGFAYMEAQAFNGGTKVDSFAMNAWNLWKSASDISGKYNSSESNFVDPDWDYELVGYNDSWTQGTGTLLNIYNNTQYIYYGTISLTQNKPFKLMKNGAWYGPNSDTDVYAGSSYSYQFKSGGNGNFVFKGTTGSYNVYVNKNTKYLWLRSAANYTATLSDGGTVGTEKSAAATLSATTGLSSGSTVTITAHPNSGYQADIAVDGGRLSASKITTDGGTATLTMPASNVMVTITYSAKSDDDSWKPDLTGFTANSNCVYTKLNSQVLNNGATQHTDVVAKNNQYWVEFNATEIAAINNNKTEWSKFYVALAGTSSDGMSSVATSGASVNTANCDTENLVNAGGSAKQQDYLGTNSQRNYAKLEFKQNRTDDVEKLGVLIDASNWNNPTYYFYSNTTSSNEFDGYYLAGRMTVAANAADGTGADVHVGGDAAQDFKADSTKAKFHDEGNGLYKYNTGKTIAELSTPVTVSSTDIRPHYFVINDKNQLWGDVSNTNTDFFYNRGTVNQHSTGKMAYSVITSLKKSECELIFDEVHSDEVSNGKVVIWLDASGVTDKTKGTGTMNIYYTLEDETTPLADSVTLSASPATQINTGNITLTATLVNPATGVNNNNCTFTFYDGDTPLGTGTAKSGTTTQATYTVTGQGSTSNGTHNYKVVVTTTQTYGGSSTEYWRVSAKTTGTFIDPAIYVSSNITSSTASPTWTQVSDSATAYVVTGSAIALSAGKSYTFTLSDTQGYSATYAKYEIDESRSRYVDISYGQKDVTVDGEAIAIRTYIFTPRVNCSNPTIYIDAVKHQVYAVANYNGTGTTSNTFSQSKTVRYYFAQSIEKDSDGSMDSITNGIKILYWNSSVAGKSGTVNGTPVAKDGKVVASTSTENDIYLDKTSFVFHKHGDTPVTFTESTDAQNYKFNLYYCDIPVWATSFKFANSSGSGITDAWEILNANRVYCLFEHSGYKIGTAVLDDSLWTQNATGSGVNENMSATRNFKTNLIKYNRSGDDDAHNAKNANSGLSSLYSTAGTDYPLYFGDYAYYSDNVTSKSPMNGYTGFNMRWNLAQRGAASGSPNDYLLSGGCAYYASIWNLTGFTLDKSTTNATNGYYLTNPNDEGGHMPLFDYASLKNNSSIATVYENKDFPFYQSTYNGVTTYSYDSLADPNRLFSNSSYSVENAKGDYRQVGAMPGYQPFADQNVSIGNEFDVDFYMTSTGAMTTTSGSDQDISFNFSGDDDVWVYVDGVKVLDLGGDHMISAGSINFTDMKVYYKTAANTAAAVASNNDIGKQTGYLEGYAGLGGSWAYSQNYVYTVDLQDLFTSAGVTFKNTDATTKHKLQMFYVERGQNESNLSLEFNLPQASGLSVKNNVTTQYVNPGLVNDTLGAASGDYFNYYINNALANSSTISGWQSGGVSPYSNVRNAASSVTGLSFAKPVYPADTNATRNVQGIEYLLAKTGQTAISAAGYTPPSSSTFVPVTGVKYYLSDENLTSKATELSGYIDSSNQLHLLSGQMANFRDSIGANTLVQVKQSPRLGTTDTDSNGVTTYEAVAKNDTGNYYITSYKITEDNINVDLQEQTGFSMLKSGADESADTTLTAVDKTKQSDFGDSFYFSSYSSDEDKINPAMTVEFFNDVAVGEVRVEKKYDKAYSTQGAKFRFTVQFANIFGDDENYGTLKQYDGLEYYVYNASDDTLVYSAPQIYTSATGIILEAGQYAKIMGVPVETRFKITERSTANHSLVEIAKTATKNTGAALNNTSLGIDSSKFYNETLNSSSTGIKKTAFDAMSTSDDSQEVAADEMTYYVNMIPIVEESILNDANRSFESLPAAEGGYESISKVVFTNKKEAFSITFKYFDRLEQSDTPSQIKTTPTAYTFNLESLDQYYIPYVDGDTLPENTNIGDFKKFDFEQLIKDYSVEFATDTNISNLLDNYHMWTNQTAAVTAMKAKTNAKSGGGSYETDNIMYHTNYIGQVQTATAAANERWVTYKAADGTVLNDPYGFNLCGQSETAYRDGDISTYDRVKSIVVWCFNEPKTYTVTVHHAANNDTMTASTVTLNGEPKTFYKSNNATTTPMTAYYNQRLGYEKEGYNDGGFFEQYGISGYTGDMPETCVQETLTSGGKTYQFAYWAFDPDGKQVASTELHYFYRITNTINLYPIYTDASNPQTVGYGLTALQDASDTYVDANGNSKTRLNVMFNPYGLVDYDPNIKDSAILNIVFTNDVLTKLGATGAENNTAILNLFNDNRSGLAAYLDANAAAIMSKNKATLSGNDYTTRGFMYTMKGNGDDNGSPANVVVALTNKNRMQFTSVFNTATLYKVDAETGEGLETKILQVTAMKYNDNGTDRWIISNNCIIDRFIQTTS